MLIMGLLLNEMGKRTCFLDQGDNSYISEIKYKEKWITF